jgi:membrane associated rhomboid family serine protease
MNDLKLLVVVMLIAIVASLGKALYHMNHGGQSAQMVQALSVRVGLSLALFGLLMLGWHFGWIAPTGMGR